MLKVMGREGPCSEPQLCPAPLGAADWDLAWAAGWLAGGKSLQSELNMSIATSVVCWPSVTLCSSERLPVHVRRACQVLEWTHLAAQRWNQNCRWGRRGKRRIKPIDVEYCGMPTVQSHRETVCISLPLAKDNVRLQLRLSFQCNVWALILKITAHDSKWLYFTSWPEIFMY